MRLINYTAPVWLQMVEFCGVTYRKAPDEVVFIITHHMKLTLARCRVRSGFERTNKCKIYMIGAFKEERTRRIRRIFRWRVY